MYLVIVTALKKKSIYVKQNVSGGVPSSVAWSKCMYVYIYMYICIYIYIYIDYRYGFLYYSLFGISLVKKGGPGGEQK